MRRAFAELTPREENRLLLVREEARALAQRYGFEDAEAHEAAGFYVLKLWRREDTVLPSRSR